MQLRELYKKFDVYWQMIATLLILASFGVYKYGFANTIPQIAVAVFVAAIFDFVIKRYVYKITIFPKSAVITGLFVALLLNVGISWQVAGTASVSAIAVKNIVRFNRVNIFNPAAIGILLTLFAFPNSSVWWGAEQLLAVAILGILILYRIKRLQMVAIFLAAYSIVSFAYSSFNVQSIQNVLLNPTLLFFAFFMLTEHKTNPFTAKGRMIYAPIAAAISFASLAFFPQYNFILGLVISNLVSFVLNQITTKTS